MKRLTILLLFAFLAISLMHSAASAQTITDNKQPAPVPTLKNTGNIYQVDADRHIRKISAPALNGVVFPGITGPYDVATDDKGDIYIVAQNNETYYKLPGNAAAAIATLAGVRNDIRK